MIPAKYCSTLGLPHNANERDVKRAYRTLVKQYHPDVNPSKEAHLKFLKITEAYEIITGQRALPKSRTRAQTSTATSATSQTKTPEQELNERREHYKRQKERQDKYEYLQQLKKHQQFQRGWREGVFKTVFYATVVCLLLITLDNILPTHVSKHQARQVQYIGVSSTHSQHLYRVHYENGGRIDVIGNVGTYIESEDIFYLNKTMLMNEVKDVVLYRGGYMFLGNTTSSIFSILPIVYILLMFPLIAKYLRKNIWAYSSTWHFAVYGTGLFLVYFFLEEMRILRIFHIIN